MGKPAPLLTTFILLLLTAPVFTGFMYLAVKFRAYEGFAVSATLGGMTAIAIWLVWRNARWWVEK